MLNTEPNRTVTAAPVVLWMGRVQIQEQRRQPEPRAEHDPRGQIPAPPALHADQLHQRDGGDIDDEKAPQRTDADQIGARAAGRADVAQRLARRTTDRAAP